MAGSVGDVQERWIEAREEWDAFERKEWRQEGEMIREAREREKVIQGERRGERGIRERK
jgi:hypothetical protein